MNMGLDLAAAAVVGKAYAGLGQFGFGWVSLGFAELGGFR